MYNQPLKVTSIDLNNSISETILPADAEQIDLYLTATGTYFVYLPAGRFLGDQRVIRWANPYPDTTPDSSITTSIILHTDTLFDHVQLANTGMSFFMQRRGAVAFLTWALDRWIVTATNSVLTSGSPDTHFFGGVGA